jgi:predicted transcriptional regulator
MHTEELITALLQDKKYNFKQKEIASFMGIPASTLSKKLSKSK